MELYLKAAGQESRVALWERSHRSIFRFSSKVAEAVAEGTGEGGGRHIGSAGDIVVPPLRRGEARLQRHRCEAEFLRES
jgi:hypothetical protein